MHIPLLSDVWTRNMQGVLLEHTAKHTINIRANDLIGAVYCLYIFVRLRQESTSCPEAQTEHRVTSGRSERVPERGRAQPQTANGNRTTQTHRKLRRAVCGVWRFAGFCGLRSFWKRGPQNPPRQRERSSFVATAPARSARGKARRSVVGTTIPDPR